jgi:hypothetical protein
MLVFGATAEEAEEKDDEEDALVGAAIVEATKTHAMTAAEKNFILI